MAPEQDDLGGGLLDMLGALAGMDPASAAPAQAEPPPSRTPRRSFLEPRDRAPEPTPRWDETRDSGGGDGDEAEGGLDALHELLVQPGLTRLRNQVNRLDRTVEEVASRLDQETRQTNHKFEDLEDYLTNELEPALQDTQEQVQILNDRTAQLAQLAPEIAELVNGLVQAQLEVQLAVALEGLEERLAQQMAQLRDQVQQQLHEHHARMTTPPAADAPTGERTLSIQVIGLRR
ncbi:MAG: hypothetical protein Fur0042_15390 [Cyanophyceae cyanobacterium]